MPGDPQRLHAGHPVRMMRQSELHGDMQSTAEMPVPASGRGGNGGPAGSRLRATGYRFLLLLAKRVTTLNGGVQRHPQHGWQSCVERKGIRMLDCETHKSSRCESRA